MPATSTKRKRRLLLFARQGGRCCYCGIIMVLPEPGVIYPPCNPPNLATIEHIRPACEGGNISMDNIKLVCSVCNWARGTLISRMLAELRRLIAE